MPNTVAQEMLADDRSGCDLVIDSFDQMRNPAELSLYPSTFTWIAPVDPAGLAA